MWLDGIFQLKYCSKYSHESSCFRDIETDSYLTCDRCGFMQSPSIRCIMCCVFILHTLMFSVSVWINSSKSEGFASPQRGGIHPNDPHFTCLSSLNKCNVNINCPHQHWLSSTTSLSALDFTLKLGKQSASISSNTQCT